MRYELSDYEWAAIKPLLPNEPRGVPLVDDRRVLNVIFGHCDQARHGAIYLTALVPYATRLISFVRWRRRVGEHPAKTKSQGTGLLQPLPYRARNLVERFFNQIKQRRRIATRYDKLAANYLAFIQLASIRLWLRVNESAPRFDRAPGRQT
jgi:transposase